MILILIGVSGIGKTTIGKLLAAQTGWHFEDADDYHSAENKKKMAAGIPLNDDDRWPWLSTLHNRMSVYLQEGCGAIFACSALKERYRERLVEGFDDDAFRFVDLQAPVDVVRQRLRAREHEYMNPQLLDSQVAAFEKPSQAWSVSVAGRPEDAVEEIVDYLKADGLLSAAKESK